MRASGTKLVELHHKAKNQRLAAVSTCGPSLLLRLSTRARAHYECRRVADDRHTAAQRHRYSRFLGRLYYCLQISQPYAEEHAFAPAQPIAALTPYVLGCLGCARIGSVASFGAADTFSKSLSLPELMAGIEASLRRAAPTPAAPAGQAGLRCKPTR
jgi:hypothetical protein